MYSRFKICMAEQTFGIAARNLADTIAVIACTVIACSAMPSMAQTSAAKPKPKLARPASVSPRRSTSAVPENTLENIRKQAATAQQRAIDMGKAAAAGELDKASNEAQSVKERAERTAAQMAGREGSNADGPQADLLRRQAAARADELQQLGSLRAARKEQESQEKAAEYQRQSESLQQELINNEDDQHRGIKLNPVGTNLYIHNYSIVKPNIQPMRAQQQTLPSTNVAGQMASHSVQGERMNSRSTRLGVNHATTNVNGRLLPKSP